jgi:hypothetical protein
VDQADLALGTDLALIVGHMLLEPVVASLHEEIVLVPLSAVHLRVELVLLKYPRLHHSADLPAAMLVVVDPTLHVPHKLLVLSAGPAVDFCLALHLFDAELTRLGGKYEFPECRSHNGGALFDALSALLMGHSVPMGQGQFASRQAANEPG